ncbi:tRNA-specific adenosine deaminase [Entomobacter blattae]|uniref:tRNA-specific adenosine deaminase n=2 Tax=Entomobacter blattae TaxID=2762277 RepID=A0A7H1NPU1_9PROT|nr:deaminase [Entomobacter blattae]QNT77801.1 tRNA-specific adenosine deaminase [Entomobacter blattae]
MFMAFNSSTHSGDLSRQVGVVITRKKQIIATGANEVPQSDGGVYWAKADIYGKVDDEKEGKDYKLGYDPNKREQKNIINDIIARIKEDKIFDNLINNEESEKIFEKKLEKILKKTAIADLTEFGRVVHAEMNALLSCCRVGTPTKKATLYCTTFPCHNCAKHIVAAGIKRVVYVEPYPKSKAIELHKDSIIIKNIPDGSKDTTKVVFEPFTGVGPRRFLDLFSMSLGAGIKIKRKDWKGDIVDYKGNKDNIKMRTPLLSNAYLGVEQEAIKIWKKRKRKRKGLKFLVRSFVKRVLFWVFKGCKI